MFEEEQTMAVVQIGLDAISNDAYLTESTLTLYVLMGVFIFAVKITCVFPGLSMGVKSLLPFPDLPDLLVTMLVFIIVIWP